MPPQRDKRSARIAPTIAAVATSMTSVSARTALRSKTTGTIIAETATTMVTLAMFDPSTLPTYIPGKPEILALIEVNNSGALVPNAMVVAAMNSLERPDRWATTTALSTVQSPPLTSSNIPNAIAPSAMTASW
jgi:hypothetical protein